MDEKYILNKIKESAKQVTPPDTLTPEEIDNKLKLVSPAKRNYAFVYKLGGLAAALVLILTFLWQNQNKPITLPVETDAVDMTTDTSNKEGATAEQTQTSDTLVLAGLYQASDYPEIYQILADNFADSNWVDTDMGQMEDAVAGEDDVDLEDVVVEEADEAFFTENAAGDSIEQSSAPDYEKDFSQTNIQEMGVDEGDTVRTDGTYLYIMNTSGQLRIVHAAGAQMELISTLTLPNLNETTEEMFLDGNTLNIITNSYSSEMIESDDDIYHLDTKSFTTLYTYDISDPSTPQLSGRVFQEGGYRTSRKVGNFIYLFSVYNPEIQSTYDDSTFVPSVNGTKIAACDILLPEVMNDSSSLVISSIDITKPDTVIDQKSIVSATETFYVSTENIYVCNSRWFNDDNTTQILKFNYQKGTITAMGATDIPGYLNDSFSLNEYQGYLRVLTTQWNADTTQNHLFILDENLDVYGKLTDLATGEDIRSARYIGETGYFVTFRDTDPLFSVDLKDPANPVLLGELKVTGFSSYLHFYGEDMLLGLGHEVDPETGTYEGIKLSMFDISDPSNVTEINKLVLKDTYDCPGLYNYKLILADPKKNLFGFQCDNNYLVFQYDLEQGFQNVFTTPLSDSMDFYGYESTRGLYIDHYFYLTNHKMVISYDMNTDFSEGEKLVF